MAELTCAFCSVTADVDAAVEAGWEPHFAIRDLDTGELSEISSFAEG